MRFQQILQSRTGAVLVGAAVLVGLGGASGAVAASMVTSHDIKNDTIRSRDVHNGTLGERDMNSYTVGKINQPGPRGKQGPPGLGYEGENWSIIDRNTIKNGDAYLRSGPSYVDSSGAVQPPSGIGSLGLRTGDGQDKADFGDQVDFAGDNVSDLQTLKYSVFTTGENNGIAAANLPNLTYEIDPNSASIQGPNGEVHYTSMVYVPKAQDPGWVEHDASEDTTNNGTSGWYFTNGPTAQATGCSQATLCTLAEAKKDIPDAKVLTVAISKGRDNAFSGAVDDLVINNTTYDFEPNGVIASTS